MAVITVKELQALGPADHGRRISLGGSMYGNVRVDRHGEVSLHVYWRYKSLGKIRQVHLGTWKDSKDAMSLRALRDERDRLAADLKNGMDPIDRNALERAQRKAFLAVELQRVEVERQEELQAHQDRLQSLAEKQSRITVRELFDTWKSRAIASRADKGAEAERSFIRDVFPTIGNMAAADVKKAHIQEVIDLIMARATESKSMVRTAKKTLADLRQMFAFALDRDYIDTDPTARIKKAKLGKDVERDRVLSEPELIELFRRLPVVGMADTSQIALLLQLSTLARIGEVLCARWEHVDIERRVWTLPETKNGKRHEIWLSDFAVRQFERLKVLTGVTPWLFPAARRRRGQTEFSDHVCEKTVTKQVGDRQRKDRAPMSGRTKHVDALVLSGGKWTPHDLRRTGATIMAELGVLPDVVERCLNHSEEKKVKRIYQRAQYERPMREGWQRLGEYLDTCQLRGSKNGNCCK